MKNTVAFLSLILVFVISFTHSKAQTTNDDDWQVLFNGEDLNDWIVKIHHHETGDNYANTFRVEDGVIQVNYDEYKEFNLSLIHI